MLYAWYSPLIVCEVSHLEYKILIFQIWFFPFLLLNELQNQGFFKTHVYYKMMVESCECFLNYALDFISFVYCVKETLKGMLSLSLGLYDTWLLDFAVCSLDISHFEQIWTILSRWYRDPESLKIILLHEFLSEPTEMNK